jgi:mannose-1-phosphate guanylyltransferase / mannose-6-phosphate isomerase
MKRDIPVQTDEARAVILAGGSGSRLWPLSRQQLPKQFLRLNGHCSLLQSTIERLQPLIAPANVLIVTSEDHAKGEAYQELLPYAALLEPVARNTAPAIAVAAAYLHRDGLDPTMVVLPADHVIKDHVAFQSALALALEAAREGALVTFGIRPTRPDTGFGYIKAVKGSGPVLDVERFTEKPDEQTARGFLEEGSYYWNSGMFVWKASAILREIERHLPEVHSLLEEMRAAADNGQLFADLMKANFHRMPAVSIDYGVLEKAQGVRLVPCDIGWSDVGSWDAYHEVCPQDENGNVVQGNVLAVDCHDSLLQSGKRLVAAVGVKDLCVIETADAILVAPRGQSQRVREIVDTLQSRNAREHLVHLTVQRPWGTYTVLEDGTSGYKIKRIEVKPGGRLSLQRHQHRSEHWVVVSGTATVVRGDETIIVTKNQSTYIPIGERHRLENRGKIPVQLIEVQVGEYLEEDDIERFDDNYGRQ